MMGAMDHSEVRQLLEDAAIEPGGLDRLMAGDTAAAAIAAGHLAGCPECTAELTRLGRSVELIRPAVRSMPSPELRERTLAFVAAVGRPRGDAVTIPAPQRLERLERPEPVDRRERPNRLGWLAAMAAALIVAVSGTAILMNANSENRAGTLSAEIDALGDVARWTLRVDSQADVRRLQLASASGDATSASLVYSPSSTELVIVADQLARPAAGKEYRCWIELDGARTAIGRMFFGGNLAYWVGKVPEVAGAAPTTRFGVSLVDLATGGPGQAALISN